MYSDTLRRRQLAALAGLGTLGDLDLELLGGGQVLAVTPNRPEATCLILDLSESPSFGSMSRSMRSRPMRDASVSPALIGATAGGPRPLAGVGLAADAVHGDRQIGVRLGGDGT